jgi:predicted phosphodiesterase
MKIQLISDIHCEFHDDKGRYFAKNLPVEGADVLVVAGDLGTVDTLHDVLKILCSRVPNVVYVAGNHEYYSSNRGVVNRALQKISKRYKNFHWLNNNVAEIDGQRFIGATMWFADGPGNWAWEGQMTDFRAIQGFKRWVYDENKTTQEFFTDNVQQGDVVVTHHLPTDLSINSKFKGSELNRFFVCDMSNLILDSKPSLWLHGHTHESCDYTVGDTNVLCNPYGYRHENHGLLNNKFNPRCLVLT